MLTPFEYICRSETGLELYAALKLKTHLEDGLPEQELGMPYSALHGPCDRCWVYQAQPDSHHCGLCHDVLEETKETKLRLRDITLIWCFFKNPPWTSNTPELPENTIGYYLRDHEHLLIMCNKDSIQDWLKNLVILYGDSLKGLLQVFPTMGKGNVICMGDILSRALHQESIMEPDRMWVRFFPEAWQLLESKKRDEQGILSFDVSEFIALIEKAKVFKNIVHYSSRNDLYELINRGEDESNAFYWGKFKRSLSNEAIDLIDSWQIKTWSKPHIEVLYELLNYVAASRND